MMKFKMIHANRIAAIAMKDSFDRKKNNTKK